MSHTACFARNGVKAYGAGGLEVTAKDDGIIISVPSEFTSLPLGFTMDAGGSLTKLVYRSKEDYTNGEPKTHFEHGRLRLRILQNNDLDALLTCIRSNCDILEDTLEKGGVGGDILEGGQQEKGGVVDNALTWFHTGFTYMHIQKAVENHFQSRTTQLSETEAMLKYLRFVRTMQAKPEFPHWGYLPISTKAAERALQNVQSVVKVTDKPTNHDKDGLGNYANHPREGFDIRQYRDKLMSISSKDLVSEISAVDTDTSFGFVTFGSALGIATIDPDDRFNLIDYTSAGAKSFLALGKAITGAKDYAELIEMVTRGNPQKVNTHTADVIGLSSVDPNDRKEFNVYSEIIGDIVVYAHGKLGDSRYKGTYTSDDVAASLALSFCTQMAKLVVLNARQQNVTSVLFSGSILSEPIIREYFETCFIEASLLLPLCGGELLKMAILPNCAHICALGTWQHNLEYQQSENPQKG